MCRSRRASPGIIPCVQCAAWWIPFLPSSRPRFDALYAEAGRRSIPPEQLLRALLLQILYTIRSERQLMEQLDYNLLYRWFVGLAPDDPVWDHSTFSKNRDRLLEGHIAEAFLQGVLKAANVRRLLSHEHFTVDGTLLEAWASHKSLRPIKPTDQPPPPDSDGDPKNPTVNWHGQKRSNATHRSTTDPDARLARKTDGTTTKLCHLGSVLVDNRYTLVVATDVRAPGYHAERDGALEMLTTLEPRAGQRTLGADRGYDERLRRGCAGLRVYAARGAEHPPMAWAKCDRRANDAARRIRGESAKAEAGGGELRVEQGSWAPPQAAAPGTRAGGLDLHLYECSVQPGANATADRRRSDPGVRPHPNAASADADAAVAVGLHARSDHLLHRQRAVKPFFSTPC